MADPGPVLQDEMTISLVSRAFGVDTPITPPQTSDDGGETPSGEYSLDFKMAVVP